MKNSKEAKADKTSRILQIYAKLSDGHILNKSEEASIYGVDERSIERDIEDIRAFLDSETVKSGTVNHIVFDRKNNGYIMERVNKSDFSNSEILAICKILLDSRAFTKNEMTDMVNKVIACCAPQDNQKLIKELISNEVFHYIEPRHKTVFINTMWDIAQAIKECRYIDIDYYRLKDKGIVRRRVKPVAIIFSEFYFYLTAFIDDNELRKHFDVEDDVYPTIYRIDRIKSLKVHDEKFHIPYSDRFEEGEFRKRVQFMYGGKLQKIKFKYKGLDINAVLDRIPTAEILSENDNVYTLSAEVFGSGIYMWLRSQGDSIELI